MSKTEMTMHERMTRIYAHQEADRAPILDSPWASTLARWRKEGLPEGVEWSLQMYRDLFKAADRRAAEWAHSKGLKVYYHSCGNINPFVPELIEVGVDMLNPMEVKAGMDPLALKVQYGDQLAFHGGLNAMCYDPPEKMWAEMERVIPGMEENGGYVIGTDHSVPDSVSLEQYRQFVAKAKELGRYDGGPPAVG